jgi:protein-tyrosine phosphatase
VQWLQHIRKRTPDYQSVVTHPIIDIHTHILPGLDDGPGSCAAAIGMAREAAAQGVTHIVATPHYNNMFLPGHGDIRDRLAELRKALDESDCGITLMAGREVSFTDLHIEALKSDTGLHYEGGKKYILLELPEGLTPTAIIEGLFDLMTAGIQPVIAHPERSSLLIKKPAFAEELRDRGALLQLDALSLVSLHGRYCRNLARRLIGHKLIDVISSDAHSREHYRYFANACQYVFNQHGEDYFREITCDTPAKIMNL